MFERQSHRTGKLVQVVGYFGDSVLRVCGDERSIGGITGKRRMVDEPTGPFDKHGHFREAMLNRLVGADRTTELLPLGDMLDGDGKRRLHRTAYFRSQTDASPSPELCQGFASKARSTRERLGRYAPVRICE